ncbi:MAG: co-chaperone GroES [Actinobacteria bacterium]|nr:MAG: co-chaperone GroES [Actinomycetota bacterium]
MAERGEAAAGSDVKQSIRMMADRREVVALGPTVRNVEPNDQVLFSPESGYEVEIRGDEYIILRERDIHAVASERSEGATGLYL